MHGKPVNIQSCPNMDSYWNSFRKVKTSRIVFFVHGLRGCSAFGKMYCSQSSRKGLLNGIGFFALRMQNMQCFAKPYPPMTPEVSAMLVYVRETGKSWKIVSF